MNLYLAYGIAYCINLEQGCPINSSDPCRLLLRSEIPRNGSPEAGTSDNVMTKSCVDVG